jgi:hypothetical protein
MITAKEAKSLAGPTAQEYVEALDPLIRAAARRNEYSLVVATVVSIGDKEKCDNFWCGADDVKKYEHAKKILTNLGYYVRTVERQDNLGYTLIGWGLHADI